MRSGRLPLFGGVAGVVTGVVISIVLLAGATLKVPPHRDSRDASSDFLAAWERSRRGTFVVESDFRRSLADGRTLYSATELVQRPPDRVTRQFGGISGTLDGHDLICSTEARGSFRCFGAKAPAIPYDVSVRTDLDNFRTYFVAAPRALYRVGYAEEGCYEFFLLFAYPSPDYGGYAKFCFDRSTGALRFLERHLANNVVETIEAVNIRTDVVRADFRTDQNEAFDSRMDLATPEPPPTSNPGPGTTLAPGQSADVGALSNRQLVERGNEVVRARGDAVELVVQAIKRLMAGSLSINDPVWIDDAGNPSPFAVRVTSELLGLGYVPVG